VGETAEYIAKVFHEVNKAKLELILLENTRQLSKETEDGI